MYRKKNPTIIVLNGDTAYLAGALDIKHSLEKWFNKKYSKTYYGIRLKKNEIDNFLNILPLRNFEKLERISCRFFMREYQSGQMGQILHSKYMK
jgi:hypothetical protein